MLGKDLVTIQGDRMIIEDISLVTISLEGQQPHSLQVRTRSEAPLDGIVSRDNFVAISTVTAYMIITVALAEHYQVPASTFLQSFNSTTLDELIGSPDLELNTFMTNQGMQIEVVNPATGQRNRVTQRWSEVYAQ